MTFINRIKKIVAHNDWILHCGDIEKRFHDLRDLFKYASGLDPISHLEVDEDEQVVYITCLDVGDM